MKLTKMYTIKIFICYILLVNLSFSVFANTSDEDNKITIKNPVVGALSGILMDYETGRILWERKAFEPMSNASTTKIMTAIIVFENANLDDVVTVSKRAASAPEVNMDLQTGEEIKLKYLLYALMLQSSNDAAVAIAEHVGGTVEDFCIMMTERAKELGAMDSIFKTPNGLDLDDHHSTAYDLAVIACHAMSMPEFVELINTTSVTVDSNKNTHYIRNTNRLLSEYQGGNGVKTGFTNLAGHCFVGSAVREDMQLISVVLASGWGNVGKEGKWTDTKNLLDYGFDNYKYETLVEAGTLGSVNILRSKTPEISYYLSEDFIYPLNPLEKEMISLEIDIENELLAPVFMGDVIGFGNVYIGEKLVAEIPIVLEDSASRHDLKTSLEKVLNSWFGMTTNQKTDLILPEF